MMRYPEEDCVVILSDNNLEIKDFQIGNIFKVKVFEPITTVMQPPAIKELPVTKVRIKIAAWVEATHSIVVNFSDQHLNDYVLSMVEWLYKARDDLDAARFSLLEKDDEIKRLKEELQQAKQANQRQ